MSAPIPLSSGSVASGGYINQPLEGAASKKIEPLVKAASPAERGRSAAKSLDDGEASPRISYVMPGS